MTLFIGIDIGTSSTKALVIDERGVVRGSAAESYEIVRTYPEWAEQPVESWWQAACNSVKAAVAAAGCKPQEIAAAGLSGQMHGTVMLDSNLLPVDRAIIWSDGRSAPQVRQVRDRFGDQRLAEMTCNPLAPGFMAATILWMMEHQPQKWRRVRTVLTPKDYIRLKMTGVVASEPSDACGTSLFNTAAGEWHTGLCRELGIDPGILPPLIRSFDEAGRLEPDAARELGLPAGLPIAAGGGDLAMDAIGTGIIRPGMACSNIGTGGQFFVVTDRPICDPRLRVHTWCHGAPELWINSGVVLSAGASLAWFCDKIACYDKCETASTEAGQVEAGADGLLFLPCLAGTRTPVVDAAARGMFAGLHAGHARAEMARAIMEGVVFAFRESLEVIVEQGAEFDSIIASGGGARSKVWRQIQADIYNRPVRHVLVDEQAAFGAALCAGVAAGFYPDIQSACTQTVRFDENITYPIQANVDRYQRLFDIFRRLYRDNRETFHLLAGV